MEPEASETQPAEPDENTAVAQDEGDADGKTRRPHPSRGRVWLFRLICVIVVPAAFFGLLELTLRLVGFGYDTRYFVPAVKTADSKPGEVETNQHFAWTFYPPTGAKAPLPVRIAPTKPADCVRIFIFGGSAAMGSPDAAYSFGRVLEVMLAERYPDLKFQVVVTAMEGMNSHVARAIADEAVDLHPDLFLVYMGNNEVVGPFGASDVFRGYTPSVRTVRASLWLKSTRTGQLVGRIIDSVTGRGKQVWMGMETFSGAGVRADDPRLATTCDNFAANMVAIREDAARAGAKSIVCTVASNLRDCPPFISSHKPGLAKDAIARFDELCAAGRKQADANQFDAAMARFKQAADIDANSADLEYWMGQCCLAAGRADDARKHLTRARDLDALRVRADTRINAAIRRAAKRYDGFVDFEKIAAADKLSRDHLPGSELLLDHVHFNFAGNCRLAAAVLPEVQRVLDDRLGAPSTTAPPALDEKGQRHLASKLALTGWDRYRLANIVANQMAVAPFTNQFDASARLAAQRKKVEYLRMFTGPEIRPAISAQYLNALDARPDDVLLRANYATFLLNFGDATAAADEWVDLLKRMPDNAEFHKEMAVVLMQQGKLAEASEHFRQALAIMPRDLNTLNNLGASLLRQNRLREAAEKFREVLRANPDHADAHVNLGITLAKQNDAAGAMAQFRAALIANPRHAGALRNLARLLAHEGKLGEAIDYYNKALAAGDDFTLHLDLAPLLDAAGKTDEAMKQYERAAEMSPSSAGAQFEYGQALLKANKPAEAAERLAKATALNDNLPAAHRDLASAYEKLGRPDRAIVEYGRALSLQPGDWVSRQQVAFLLMRAGRLPEAIEQYKKLLVIRPDLADAHNNLAVALAKTNKLDDAIIHFSTAVQLDPTAARHYNLAVQLVRRGADAEAIAHFREAIRLRPDWPAPMSECAWVLATADDARLRNGNEAMKLARKACELTGWKDAGALDALAAAMAESGQFGQALMTAKTARQLAAKSGNVRQVERIDKRIALYQASKPCRRGAREIR